MLETIVIAAALYVCPGEVYSDQAKPGCHPIQQSNKEGFSTIPEAPEFNSKFPDSDEGGRSRESQSRFPAASARECAMYEEWVQLSTKTSSLGARDLSAEEYERWTNLKQVFGNSPPPLCR